MTITKDAESLTKRPLYVFDLPRDLFQNLETKSTSSNLQFAEEDNLKETTEDEVNSPEPDIPRITACSLCNLSFANLQDQRTHVRSDLHRYNLKQRIRGLKPLSEQEFEKLIGDLDESISGSDTSSSASDDEESKKKPESNTSKLSALFRHQAHLDDGKTVHALDRKRKGGGGKPPLIWFRSSALPKDTTIGIYRALFFFSEQQSESDLVSALQCKQLESHVPQMSFEQPKNPPDGGVALPVQPQTPASTPHVFMCMIGGGHFAGMIVSLAPKVSKSHNAADARQATVIAHKTFHRYTTRRKQGGAQSSNDQSKGNAHSAGASIRRYNEEALVSEVRSLLKEWKQLIDTSELFFVRATGSTNRNTLFGLAKEDQSWPLRSDDTRLRGFPFSTRRATQSELMRCFVELTRAKIKVVDEEAERRAAVEAKKQAEQRRREEEARLARQKEEDERNAKLNAQEQESLHHTSQLTALIRRNKAPALLSYMTTNGLDPSYHFYPRETPAYFSAPTPLHFAASTNSPAVVMSLLVKGGADPTILNAEQQTPFELAGDRATKDAFSVARSELGESKWDWREARVPAAMSREEVARRAEQAKKEEQDSEVTRRQEGLQKLREEEASKEEERKQRGFDERGGKGKSLMTAGGQRTAQEKREEEARGMTPEMKMRMEREKRARAVEERMKRLQG